MSLRTAAMQSCSIMSLRAVRRSNPADLRKSAYALADLLLFIVGFHPTYNSSKLKSSGEKFYQISEIIMKVCGVLLILVALFLYYKIFSILI